MTPAPAPRRRIVRTYDYLDSNGRLQFQVVRYEPKSFRQRRPDGVGGWIWNIGGTKPSLYRLPEILAADPNESAFLFEGERDSDNAAAKGMLSTTTPMGAMNGHRCDLSPLYGRRVVLVPDQDKPDEKFPEGKGVAHMRVIAEMLAEEALSIEWLNLPFGKDFSDYIAAGGTVADLMLAITPYSVPEQPHQTSATAHTDLLSLKSLLSQWPEPMGEEAFAGLAGEIVEAILPHSEADPHALLVQLLSAFGSAVGASPHCQVAATSHSMKINAVIVGETAKARKGDSWNPIYYVMTLADRLWAERRVKQGLSSGEGVIHEVRDAREEKQPIKEKGRVVDYQSVLVDEGVTDKRLLIIESEFARALRAMERQGNTLSPIVRQAWDGDRLSTLTKASPETATGAHVTLIGHITNEELRRSLAAVEIANGFANRFLFIAARRSKLLPEPMPIDESVIGPLAIKFAARIEWAQSIGEIQRDEEARQLWGEVYADLSCDRDGLAGGLLARAEAQVLRLSAVYALLDGSNEISVDHLLSALEVWGYCERSVEFVFADALGDPVADTISGALRGGQPLTRSEIRDLFGRHETQSRVDQALSALHSKSLVQMTSEETGGRPRELWHWTGGE